MRNPHHDKNVPRSDFSMASFSSVREIFTTAFSPFEEEILSLASVEENLSWPESPVAEFARVEEIKPLQHKPLLHEHDDFLPVWKHPSASSQPLGLKQKDQPRSRLQRLKRGIPGFVNGRRIAAFPDTGSAQNVVSAAFVKERGLHVKESEEAFKLGNSKITKSTGKLTKVPTWHLRAAANLNLSRHRGLGMGICR